MRFALMLLLVACCGCKSSPIWRPKPDNFARRAHERTQSSWIVGNSDGGGLQIGARRFEPAE